MKIRTLKYYFKESFKSIIRNRVMSLASISTVTLALFIFGIFMTIMFNVNKVMNTVENQIEIKAFVKEEYNTTIKSRNIEQAIKEIPGVKEVKYESKKGALQNFKEQLGENEDLAKGLESENPLPAAFIIKVDNPEKVVAISKSVSDLEGILKVKDGKTIIEKIIKVTKFVNMVSLVLMILLGVISIFLISNTIKLTVYARKREIGIMKYVGATDWFIRWPFIIEGVMLGLIGSVISVTILYFLYGYASNAVTSNIVIFSMLPKEQIMGDIMLKFTLIGMGIGGFGSFLSLRKFLVI